MRPQDLDELDLQILRDEGTITIESVIAHDCWPDFEHEMRDDGLTAIRYPGDAVGLYLVNPDELAALFILRAGVEERAEHLAEGKRRKMDGASSPPSPPITHAPETGTD